MPEIDEKTSFLIAISFQAQKRAETSKEVTKLADCTVMVLFASFYLESYLNVIFEEMVKTHNTHLKDNIWVNNWGLKKKFCWFYNSFIMDNKSEFKDNIKELRDQIYSEIEQKIEYKDFNEIVNFRNEMAHGGASFMLDLTTSIRLRDYVKKFAEDLRQVASRHLGYEIPRLTTYYDALKYYRKTTF